MNANISAPAAHRVELTWRDRPPPAGSTSHRIDLTDAEALAIIEEAEAISRQLRNNQLSQDLLNRQENIVSRLLDAQRSINKRDKSERRQAEAADPATRQEAVDTDYDALRRQAMLEDSYRLFPPAYQQVILKYLKLLNE